MSINPAEVERLVRLLQGAMEGSGGFEGGDAMSAVSTFHYRFGKALLLHTPRDKRVETSQIMASAMRKMAGLIEFETVEDLKERIH